MAKAILHLDMDAFYASVEQRDDPSLRGRPLIVGGHPTRGVVLAASYEARPLGVRSAMPMSRALRQAPQAIVVPPRFSAYLEASERVFEIFASATPLVEPISLDEAFLDVTSSVHLFGSPGEIARKLRARIAAEVGLPASAGIACTKFVAKIASDLAKPNGQKEVGADETISFLAPLPVSRLWGVGPKLAEVLKSTGLKTLGDVAARDPSWLERRLGVIGPHLWELSHGKDDRPVLPDREAKSIGAEDTFEEDLPTEALAPHIHSQSLRVARRLRSAGRKGRVVQLKLKLADFALLTRQLTLPEGSDDGQEIYRAAIALLGKLTLDRKVRLTGISVHGMESDCNQLKLFAAAGRSDKLNQALDRIAEKFGSSAVVPADVFGEGGADDVLRRAPGASRLDARKERA
ncbi:MAG TPA: DNA polymerase IV [Myxococcaceae bacterium]|nr:DNA polymerase IV [Myxococcaceae bacterium]